MFVTGYGDFWQGHPQVGQPTPETRFRVNATSGVTCVEWQSAGVQIRADYLIYGYGIRSPKTPLIVHQPGCHIEFASVMA